MVGYSSGRGDLNFGYSYDLQVVCLNYGVSGGILIYCYGVVFILEMNGVVVLIDVGGVGGVIFVNQKIIVINGDGYVVLFFVIVYYCNDVFFDSYLLLENVDLVNSIVMLVFIKDVVVLVCFYIYVGYKVLFMLQLWG